MFLSIRTVNFIMPHKKQVKGQLFMTVVTKFVTYGKKANNIPFTVFTVTCVIVSLILL